MQHCTIVIRSQRRTDTEQVIFMRSTGAIFRSVINSRRVRLQKNSAFGQCAAALVRSLAHSLTHSLVRLRVQLCNLAISQPRLFDLCPFTLNVTIRIQINWSKGNENVSQVDSQYNYQGTKLLLVTLRSTYTVSFR